MVELAGRDAAPSRRASVRAHRAPGPRVAQRDARAARRAAQRRAATRAPQPTLAELEALLARRARRSASSSSRRGRAPRAAGGHRAGRLPHGPARAGGARRRAVGVRAALPARRARARGPRSTWPRGDAAEAALAAARERVTAHGGQLQPRAREPTAACVAARPPAACAAAGGSRSLALVAACVVSARRCGVARLSLRGCVRAVRGCAGARAWRCAIARRGSSCPVAARSRWRRGPPGGSSARARELVAALAERNRELEAEQDALAELAVRRERARIARELHDIVAHHLAVMVIQAGAGRLGRAGRRAARFAGIRDAGTRGARRARPPRRPARRPTTPRPRDLEALLGQARAAGVQLDYTPLPGGVRVAPELDATAPTASSRRD